MSAPFIAAFARPGCPARLSGICGGWPVRSGVRGRRGVADGGVAWLSRHGCGLL